MFHNAICPIQTLGRQQGAADSPPVKTQPSDDPHHPRRDLLRSGMYGALRFGFETLAEQEYACARTAYAANGGRPMPLTEGSVISELF